MCHNQPAVGARPAAGKSVFLRKRLVWLLAAAAALGLALAVCLCWTGPQPSPPTKIFQGVVYRCERLPGDAEGAGRLFLVEVDLAACGVELYVTPVEDEAAAAGWEYRLRWTPSVAADENLAVVVNGTLFAAESKAHVPGLYARSLRTVVAEHRPNHVDADSYLLWFEDDLTPHLEKRKPPPAEALRRRRWAVSGEMVLLDGGKPNASAGHRAEGQTICGLNRQGRLVLAVFRRRRWPVPPGSWRSTACGTPSRWIAAIPPRWSLAGGPPGCEAGRFCGPTGPWPRISGSVPPLWRSEGAGANQARR